MYAATAFIRDYNQATDTCSVELVGMGVLDTWLDGVKISSTINRAALAGNVEATVTFPDSSRLCEGTVSALIAGQQPPTSQASGTNTKLQSVRVGITTGGGGGGSAAVVWPIAFSAPPTQVYASPDNQLGTVSVSAVTAAGCTLTITGGPINSVSNVTATALGAA
jgi:hypothetical protein